MTLFVLLPRVGGASKARLAALLLRLYSQAALFKVLLRVVRDVDKAEKGCAVALIIVQSYVKVVEMDILERG